jgi:hypothetical protein
MKNKKTKATFFGLESIVLLSLGAILSLHRAKVLKAKSYPSGLLKHTYVPTGDGIQPDKRSSQYRRFSISREFGALFSSINI